MSALSERTERAGGRWAYRGGVALMVLTSFLTVWTTIVRDDGNGAACFMPILAGLIAALAAGGAPVGLARGLVGVAVMQGVIGLLVATEPATKAAPQASLKVMIGSGGLAAFWLVAGGLFLVAAKGRDRGRG